MFLWPNQTEPYGLQQKNVFAQDCLNLQDVLHDITKPETPFFLSVNKSTCSRMELHLTNSDTCTHF